MRNVRNTRQAADTPSISAARLKPLTLPALPIDGSFYSFGNQSAFVHELTLNSIGLRCRQPMDICTKYQLNCEDRTLFIRDSHVRVLSCRRAEDGMYDISTEICR
jgi:hypothetical protein